MHAYICFVCKKTACINLLSILEACLSASFMKTWAWQNPGVCPLCQGRQQPDSQVCVLLFVSSQLIIPAAAV